MAATGNTGLLVGIGGIVGTFTGLFGVFVVWIVTSGCFHVTAKYRDDIPVSISFRVAVMFVGWGFMPTIIGGLISTLAIYVVLSGVTFPSDPEAAVAIIKQLRLSNNPVIISSQIVRLVLLVWQGFIWAFAVANAYDIDIKNAVLVVAPGFVLFMTWNVYNLL